MEQQNNGITTSTFIPCHIALNQILQQLEACSFPIEGYQIDGSLRTGVYSCYPINDADVIIFLHPDVVISEEIALKFAQAVEGKCIHIAAPFRFGQRQNIAHVTSAAPRDCSFLKWDFWLVHAPFVTMSPVWSMLFSEEERNWQREIRRAAKIFLSDEKYQICKSAQLCEARWRFCASHGLSLAKEHLPRCQSILDDLPLKECADPLIQDFAMRWHSGDLSDPWLIRPLTQVPSYILNELENLGVRCDAQPLAPAWTEIAHQFQQEIL